MTIVIHHNPDCGKPRNVLEIIRASGADPVDIEYLKTGCTRPRLPALFAAANLPPRDDLRTTSSPAQEMGLREPAVSADALPEAMLDQSVLVNRPIVCSPVSVQLCRPAEVALERLNTLPPGPPHNSSPPDVPQKERKAR